MTADLATLIRLRYRLIIRAVISGYTRSAREAAPARLIVLLLVLAWVLVAMVVPVSGFLSAQLSTPQGRSQLTPFLASGSAALGAFMFFYGVMGLAAGLTSTSDLKLLLLTPVSPWLILGQKILTVSLGFSGLELILLPLLIEVGNNLHANPVYNLVVLLWMILILPVGPVALATLLVLALIRWVPPARVRALTAVMGMATGALAFIGTQLVVGVARPGHDLTLPSVPTGLPTAWPGEAIAAAALGRPLPTLTYGLGVTALSIALLTLAITLTSRALTTGWSTFHEVGRRSRTDMAPAAPSPAQLPLTSVTTGPAQNPTWWPLLHKEWLTLRRDPQRLAQLAYPLIIVGFYAYRILGLHHSAGSGFQGLIDASLYFLLVLNALLLTTSLASTIINREGNSLYLLALAPFSPSRILYAKWAVCIIPVTILELAVLAVGAAVLQLSPGRIVITGLTMVGLVITMTGVVITINLIWPRLNADNPRRQANPIATIVSMASEFALGATVSGLLILTFSLWPAHRLATLISGAALFLVLAVPAAGSAIVGSRLLGRLLSSGRMPS